MAEAPREITLGLLGVGTVGTGVLRLLAANAKRIESRLSARLVVKRVACRDLSKTRDDSVDQSLLTDRIEDVTDDPDIDLVLELIGGVDDAHAGLLRAIEHGKHVVTANKALLATHGESLMRLAADKGVDLNYEASVGGGIPIIRSIREALASDRIRAVYGIINGTTNYILTRMTREGLPFDQILEQAVAGGYAEADPSLDVDGIDAAQKLAILAALAFGLPIRADSIYTEGIRNVTAHDIRMADELGYVIKLLAIARERDGAVDLRVHPALVPKSNLLSHVNGVYNAVLLDCEAVGFQLLYGRGAGMMPTAGAVVSDVIEVGRNILQRRHGRLPGFGYIADRGPAPTLHAMEEVRFSYYFHFDVTDSPGVLGQIASILGDHGISIAQMKQTGQNLDGAVPVVILSHEAVEGSVQAALKQIDRLECMSAPSRLIRVVIPEISE
jgi:homoserine dehydrogenase